MTERKIRKEFSKIEVVALVAGNAFAGGGLSAHLRQIATTIYPGPSAGNSKQDSVFEDSEFEKADPPNRVFSNPRNGLMKVPPINPNTGQAYTAEEVQALLDAKPEAHLYRSLSNNVFDVMTKEQIAMFKQGRLTYYQRDSEGKIMLDGKGAPIQLPHTQQTLEEKYEVRDKEGTRWTDAWGNRQYRAFYLATSEREDEDFREGAVQGLPRLATIPSVEEHENAVTATVEELEMSGK